MHSWKKKLVVSQLALACTLAITSQANAANYDTWGYHDNTTTDLVWPYDTDNDGIADAGGMDPMGSDGNYVTYNGFVYYNNANGDFDTVFKGDTVNGTISTYYLNHDYASGSVNQVDISNSVIHGSITSELPLVITALRLKVIMAILSITELLLILTTIGTMVTYSL